MYYMALQLYLMFHSVQETVKIVNDHLVRFGMRCIIHLENSWRQQQQLNYITQQEVMEQQIRRTVPGRTVVEQKELIRFAFVGGVTNPYY